MLPCSRIRSKNGLEDEVSNSQTNNSCEKDSRVESHHSEHQNVSKSDLDKVKERGAKSIEPLAGGSERVILLSGDFCFTELKVLEFR